MTNRLERRNYGKGHGYKVDGRKVIGVTTAIGVLDKPALVDWAARTVADRAVNGWDELAVLPPMERWEKIRWGARDAVKAASLRGTEIHSLGEKLAKGVEVDVPPEHVGPVEAYARFLDRWDVEILATETPVAHTLFGYGGTADVWGVIHRLGGERIALDVKTGKGVYPEVRLQLAGYMGADLWQPDGPLTAEQRKENTKRKRKGEDLIEPREEPMPEWDAAYVAHVLPDDVRLIPVRIEDVDLLHLRYLIALARRKAELEDDTPLGAPMVADDYPDDREETPA